MTRGYSHRDLGVGVHVDCDGLNRSKVYGARFGESGAGHTDRCTSGRSGWLNSSDRWGEIDQADSLAKIAKPPAIDVFRARDIKARLPNRAVGQHYVRRVSQPSGNAEGTCDPKSLRNPAHAIS
jgi:hypothetical protein